MTKRNYKSSSPVFLRGLPFLLTLMLFLSLMLTMTGQEAQAESSQAGEEDEALPEYSITLSDAQSSSSCGSVTFSGGTVTITEAGSYTLTGSLSDGQICVDTARESKVRLILDGVSITSSGSAAIYVRSADKVVISLKDGTSSTLGNGGSFVQSDENNVDGVIFSKDDLTIKGNGSLTISSPAGHGIVGKDDLKIKGGTVSVTAARKSLSANDTLTVDDGVLSLNAGTEGMEASNVVINGGSVSVQAGDDGINATWTSDTTRPAVEINGGSLTIVMGAGDTDGVDSNGDLVITGGTIDITGSSSFDIDGSVTFTGGTVIVNGQQVESIPNQMMGMGGFGGMGRGGMGAMDQGSGQDMSGFPGGASGEENGFFPGQDGSGAFGGFGGMGGGRHGMGGSGGPDTFGA